ncbi:MAG: formate dehydrogenase subunit gamma [Candidatus Aminicenantia bacterium]
MKDKKNEIQRFDLNQRIQHIILFLCLIVLSLTGLALRFYDTWFGRLLMKMEGGESVRGWIHRITALIFMGFCFYHFFYAVFSRRGHQELMNLKPTRKDFGSFISSVKFNLGLSKKRPTYDRFSYKEKFQYWGVTLGSALMIITGLILWAGTNFMNLLPKWILDLTLIIHGYEGVLLFIILFVWHIYNVHLSPDVFPMSKVWLTGRISVEEMKKNHPLEYDRVMKKEK